MQTFNLDSSKIVIGNIEKSNFGELLSTKYETANKVILVDENTNDCCLEYLITTFEQLDNAEVMLLPTGEENKVMEVCFQVFTALSEYHFNKNDLLICLGGGVVTDLGGFIASVYKRGMNFIHIPTSLLAMVDAAIGGKNGINMGQAKNQIGTINQPDFVFIDHRFLATLPEEELANGYAEMLKHALIGNKELWETFQGIDPTNLPKHAEIEQFITQSCKLKISVVKEDIKDKGLRQILNFGHTFGHAIEGFCLDTDTPIDHGHAIALGMLAESYLSFKLSKISERDLMEICSYISQIYSPLFFNQEEKDLIITLMYQDKKNDSNEISCVLLDGIGKATFGNKISTKQANDALIYMESVYNSN